MHAAVRQVVERFGGIDVLVNNASAINLTNTDATPMKRFDLMFGVNVRGTYLCTQACLPHLKRAAEQGRNAHVLTLSPPLAMQARWFAPHVAYTMAKYGMSMCVLGHAEEFAPGIGVNALWPRTVIQTAALQMNLPGMPSGALPLAAPSWPRRRCASSERRCAQHFTGNFFIDEEVLAAAGVSNFDDYAVVPGSRQLLPDLFL